MLLCIKVDGEPPVQWEELLDALDAVSPLIDDVRPGLAFADMHGSAGSPPEWIDRARATIAPFTSAARLGVGRNKICARAAATLGDGNVCPNGSERAFLAPFTLDVFEIESDAIERLRLLGIDRAGDLARLPHGPFVRRFGPQAARWHAWARGEDPTPFVPRGHAVAIEAAILGEGRTEDEAQVVFALRLLLSRICSDLERCGKRAGRLSLDIELEDAHTQTIGVTLASPTISERAMLDVVRAKLEGMTFAAPIVGLRLRAGDLEEGGEQVALFSGSDFDPQAVAVAISRLEAMLGEPVRHARTHAAHVLEERYSYDDFKPPKVDVTSERSNVILSATRRNAPSEVEGRTTNETIVPQLRLMSVSEITVSVRNGAPAAVSVHDGNRTPRTVLECSGPWRVEIGWFSDACVVRDEYDVLLEDGELYRIYRQGSQWYLRGTYD